MAEKKEKRDVSRERYVAEKREDRKEKEKLKKEKGALRKENMDLKKAKSEAKKEVKKEEADCKEEIKKTKKEIGKKVAKRFAEEKEDKRGWIKLTEGASRGEDECNAELEELKEKKSVKKKEDDNTMLIGGLAGILLGIFLGRR